jgi:DNA polymerase III delta prime subunit
MNAEKKKSELYYEKFRCKKIEQIDLLPRIASVLGSGILTQNLLLYSTSPGTCKTTISRILAGDLPTLELNASIDSSIDIIRQQITDFCSTLSVLDGAETLKVVFFDEADGLSSAAFGALKGLIEKFADNVRFIFTCNYLNKIPEAIQSRFLCINMEPINVEEENWLNGKLVTRFGKLFQALKINISPPALTEFIEKNSPDVRTLYNKTQAFKLSGVTEIDIITIRSNSYSYLELYQMLVGQMNPVSTYQFIVSNYSGQTDDVLQALGSEFIEFIREKHPLQMDKIPVIIISVAEYQAKRLHVIDPVVNCLAAIFSIQKALNSVK